MILLLGVAHVVDLRASLTAKLREFAPGAIALDLDPDRLQSLVERARDPSAAHTRARAPVILRLWSSVQERLASEMGEMPGAEMLIAMEVARELGIPTFLIDDPLQQVAPRLLHDLTPKERVQLLISSVIALFVPARVVKRELQNYTEEREQYMAAMREQFPTVTRVLLDERNGHMADRLAALGTKYERVVAVLGDAHLSGIEALLRPRAEVQTSHLVVPG